MLSTIVLFLRELGFEMQCFSLWIVVFITKRHNRFIDRFQKPLADGRFRV